MRGGATTPKWHSAANQSNLFFSFAFGLLPKDTTPGEPASERTNSLSISPPTRSLEEHAETFFCVACISQTEKARLLGTSADSPFIHVRFDDSVCRREENKAPNVAKVIPKREREICNPPGGHWPRAHHTHTCVSPYSSVWLKMAQCSGSIKTLRFGAN